MPELPFIEYYPIIPFKEEPLEMFLARVANRPLQESLLEPDNFHIRHNKAGLVSMVRGRGRFCGFSIFHYHSWTMPDGQMIVMPPLV